MNEPEAGTSPEWDEWLDAVENFGDDPALETFERVREAGQALLAVSMPPPGSREREPHRLKTLVRYWHALDEAQPGPVAAPASRLKDRTRWLKASDVVSWFRQPLQRLRLQRLRFPRR